MKKLSMQLVLVLAVTLYAGAAMACDGDCVFKDGKSKWMLTEVEGSGFLAVLTIAGTPEEVKAATDKAETMIAGCTAGKCECKDVHHCPFTVDGLDYKVSRTEKGLAVEVSGGCPGKRGMFKQLMEARLSGKIGEAKGGCPHAAAHKKKGGCPHADSKEGCKGDGSCDCHKDKK
jgi:hypothetical protein